MFNILSFRAILFTNKTREATVQVLEHSLFAAESSKIAPLMEGSSEMGAQNIYLFLTKLILSTKFSNKHFQDLLPLAHHRKGEYEASKSMRLPNYLTHTIKC